MTRIAASDPRWHPGLNPQTRAQRIVDGRRAENEADRIPPGLVGSKAPSYFRTYDQVKDAMYALQTKYPEFVKVRDIGDSMEKSRGTADRDILAMTITSPVGDVAKKPIASHVGGQHAREIANPELLMTWAEQTLAGYGRDAEATSLLDTRQIDIVPIMNPDGHAVVERAFVGEKGGDLMQRKNTTPPNGTDLNRNWDFHWGGPGASSFPMSQTYRGSGPASESETKAIQDFVASRKPNMFIDWHSYSELVLYPWGDTKDPAPDHQGLKSVAERFARFNHYSPIQSVDLYPTTGTSDDWAYGRHKIPSFAIETGRSFHQSDKEFATTLQENLPVLTYSTRIADAPYERAQGPDVADFVIDPASRSIRARIDGSLAGTHAVTAAELVLDPATPAGKGIALTAGDGRFDAVTEEVVGALPPADAVKGAKANRDVAGGGRLAWVRARNAAGNWGPLAAQWLTTPARATAS